MKRWLLAGLMVCCAASAFAQGMMGPQTRASVFVGAAGPMNRSGLKAFGQELDWGSAAVGYGASVLRFVTPWLAVGAEYNAQRFSWAEYNYFQQDDVAQINAKTRLDNWLAAGRMYFNAEESVRWYLPVGLGVARAQERVRVEENGLFLRSFQSASTSFTYYAGLGVEGDLSEVWTLGIEGRFASFWFNNRELGWPGAGGHKRRDYLSLLVALGYKF